MEKKLKKFSSKQLENKLKSAKGVERETIEQILTQRGVKIESDSNLKEEVDKLFDLVIKQNRTGIYEEMIKALGGKFDSDVEVLLEGATEAQLREALTFRKMVLKEKEETSKKEKEISKPSKKEETSKREKESSLEKYVTTYSKMTLTVNEIKTLKTKREKVVACWFAGIRDISKISEIADYAKGNVRGIINLAKLKEHA